MSSKTDEKRDMARYEKAYAESSFEPVQARMRKQVVLEQLRLWQPASVLEVGCGADPLFNHYRQFARMVVVEPGRGFSEIAREQAAGSPRIHIIEDFLENAIESGALTGEHFDCVIVSGLLHELHDPGQLLRVLHRVVGADCRLHVNVPNARSLHRLLAFEMGIVNDIHEISGRQESLQQNHTFDIKSLKALCVASGYRVIEEGSFFVKPFTHAQMYLLSEIGLLDERMLTGLMRLEKHLPGMGSEIFVNLMTAPQA
ncbi:MAG: methyltransferase domain-containing protein [Lautropia sp.]|nr:methyltransferase domain-containing protein [Lautropia sp.]